MIDIKAHRGMYVFTPAIPVGTESINYEVSIGGDLIFVGHTKYFGGTYEIDSRDWFDSYIWNQTQADTLVTSVTLSIAFTFYDEDGTTISTSTLSKTWQPIMLGLTPPPQPADYSKTYCNIELLNCGFIFNGGVKVRVPLQVCGTKLVGKTINKLEKITYVDKYGDTHNGSMSNSYELECFIDPDWLNVKTNGDMNYEMIALALQGAQKSTLKGCGEGGFTPIQISGMDTVYVNPGGGGTMPLQYFNIPGRVKDVKKVETYSSYSNKKKLPTIKVTFEIYYI